MNFYDTCAILNLQQEIFKDSFLISDITLKELEEIKTSTRKDEETKWRARNILRLLIENSSKCKVCLYSESGFVPTDFNLIDNNDSKIICTVCGSTKDFSDIVFVTSDLSCYVNATALERFKTSFLQNTNESEEYFGYKEVSMTKEELGDFYTDIKKFSEKNEFNLLDNEYLLIKDEENNIIDKYKYVEETKEYKKLPFYNFNSRTFGKISPKDNDPYQHLAMDSLSSNRITMLRGKAGSGKTMLAFGYMFYLLEKNEIDKIIVFCNTVATKNSARLGFYPGSRVEKLLDSQIGNLLESKLGDKIAVWQLIDNNKLILLPMSDIRGYDTTGMNAAVYLSEAQNLDIELMKLALQRIGDDSICIIDGDYKTQLDLPIYDGEKNGMRRASEVFRGHPFYGEVELKNIHRSKIAEIADKM